MFKTVSLLAGLAVFLFANAVNAESKKETVVSMMESSISHFNKVGAEQAYKDFAVKGSEFNKGAIYVFVSSLKGDGVVFHGANPKLVGKKLGKLKDTDGKLFVKEFRDIANGPGKGWVDYKWPHPATKKITPKHTLINKVGDYYFAIGYFD